MPPVADAVEARHAVLVAAHRLSVDNAGAGAQAGQGLKDQREAIGEIIARQAIEPHMYASLASNDPKPIVLDFVQPFGA